ncbi:uncharacterized protein B0H18DRAFT_14324 [Fomitopsis serialis]|uniref:uncharacterized protein n=1 Tax=Fomitopsis serialis TaxID=139415 RepID=UPI002008ABF5|nr:uncharacterized protein B0H18DRAFT_461604 [Neoantrodia serialis]XP_047901230.1 uncharacterized protein B0H18DRAFT_14324 [Neoantrodia serialis]KAH9910504.1 hypothetical protein B0H18DRAFT_461604 [Neoantrodia serialis]KAH9938411.1 hypothetical protein B0H18DRAFT_14324 [Neoantrodia serialis]
MLKIGERAYPVDPSRDPRRQRRCSKIAAPRPLNVGQDDDPLAQQMVALKKEEAAHGGRVSTSHRARIRLPAHRQRDGTPRRTSCRRRQTDRAGVVAGTRSTTVAPRRSSPARRQLSTGVRRRQTRTRSTCSRR